ncbi:DUF5808 domain-containing protein [Pedobacter paludis]|uniref:DUF5808 domain-containing protein n=1 Tax=Pedobacter paludis TaxID=2203212 RepID=A0A317F3G9_9SPHI|nr:DUF5808 domain-containing protein [Pedobacter paludis]PWS33710.1 hypothetical protein DF947_03610 [Pedobacter paludis]
MEKDFQQENSENWKWGFFYYNVKDPRIFVPKRLKLFGWTLNFAKPVSYLIVGLILAFIVYARYQK